MPLPLIPIALGAINWIRTSTVGRYVAIAGAVLLAIITMRGVWRRQGAAEAKDYITRKANNAAVKRRDARVQIELGSSRVGAADRLRKRWVRD